MFTLGRHEMLELKDLQAGYGAVPVLRKLSFEVKRGETLVLLGRNGVGKTTLLRSIMGLLPLSSGSVALSGVDITRWAPHEIARHGVAYVPQGRGIFPKLTVEENLLTGLRGRRDGRKDIPKEVFDYFPILRERLQQRGGTFSGGQQQILAIARALCGQPDVLLLDEPSEGIQPSIVQQIGDLIGQFNRDLGLTVLLVEQNLELVRRTCSRCLVMSRGHISGTLEAEDLHDESKVFAALAV
jgi:urea ABC transporter ATP-binding protein UrtE